MMRMIERGLTFGSLETVLRKTLVAMVRTAAQRLHPAVLHEMVLSVGVELGRQAAADYRLVHHLTGRFDNRACATCLQAVGKELGWELRASVDSDSVIRIDELGCAAERFGQPDPYLMEVGYGIIGGIVADEFGYAKVCAVHHRGLLPFHRTITIYLQESEESRAVPGIVFPLTVDEMARFQVGRLKDGPTERLTSRETEVFRFIAQGQSDKEIAAALHLSVRTVQNHAAQVRHKLGIGSRTALVRFALRAPVGNR